MSWTEEIVRLLGDDCGRHDEYRSPRLPEPLGADVGEFTGRWVHLPIAAEVPKTDDRSPQALGNVGGDSDEIVSEIVRLDVDERF